MSHYFKEDKTLKSDRQTLTAYYGPHEFSFVTDAGIFSKDHVDPATDILLRAVPPLSGSLLDLGCGYGVVGIVLARLYGLSLTQSDVNRAALRLTEENCRDNGIKSEIIESDCYENIPGRFDAIALNPPIHAGKGVTYRMYEGAPAHLNSGGRLFVVTLKKHGAESTKKKLTEVFGSCETIYKKKGYCVFCCTKGEGGEENEI